MEFKLAEKIIYNSYKALYLAVFKHKTHKNNHITFVNMPYLIDIYKDNSPDKVLMKSTQSGVTEYLVIDTIKETYYENRNIFYVMPTDKLKNMFVSTRFDQSIINTPYYRNIIKESKIDNMSIKQINSASIFFAVSNSRSNFTSFPADTAIVDEEDECNQENIEMLPERLAFSLDPRTIRVGNPTYPDFGIDYRWKQSDKKHWFIKCDCGNSFNPDFFKHIVKQTDDNDYMVLDKTYEFNSERDANLICDKCHKPVFRYGNGEWVNEQKSRISGRQMSQIFTSRKRLDTIIGQFKEAQSNPIKMQRFYNGTLGLPFLGEGAQLTDDDINNCIRDYKFPGKCEEPCVIGIDVGKVLHAVIFKLVKSEEVVKLKLVYAGELRFTVTKKNIDISELYYLKKRFNIIAGLIDAAPEDRLSRMITQNFPEIWRCRYLTENPIDSMDDNAKIYKTDRTMSMDGVKENILLEHMIFPSNLDLVQGFREQLKTPIRVFEEKETTNGRWVWREGNKPDHYYHAVNYANIAKKLLLMK